MGKTPATAVADLYTSSRARGDLVALRSRYSSLKEAKPAMISLHELGLAAGFASSSSSAFIRAAVTLNGPDQSQRAVSLLTAWSNATSFGLLGRQADRAGEQLSCLQISRSRATISRMESDKVAAGADVLVQRGAKAVKRTITCARKGFGRLGWVFKV